MKNFLPLSSEAAGGPARCSRALVVLVALLLSLSACFQSEAPRNFNPDNYPETLSEWRLMQVSDEHLQLHPTLLPYDLATPLFSDYALKLRTVWMPPGSQAQYRDAGPFEFPKGTIISKTFYYLRDPLNPGQVVQSDVELDGFTPENGLDLQQVRLIETRLLVRQAHGWDALPYVWDAGQKEAQLQPGGAIERLTLRKGEALEDFAYIVPNQNECAACHVTDQRSDQLQPLGPAARHLTRLFAHFPEGEQAQLQYWEEQGLLGFPAGHPGAGTEQQKQGLDAQARAYLDINCGHCHQPGGSADTSGLFLHAAADAGLSLGVCKPPVAAGRGTGGRRYSIVPGKPDESILLFRMQSREPDVQMPELGRSLVHEEGVNLLREWIAQMEGGCGPASEPATGVMSGPDNLKVVSDFHAAILEHDRR